MVKGEKTAMKKGEGKRKIPILNIKNSQSRLVSFSKRRQGLFKKSQELSSISGTQIGILVESQAGQFYTYGSSLFDSIVDRFLQGTNMDEPMPEKNIESDLESAESSEPNGTADYGVLKPWRFWLDLDVNSYDNVEELMGLMNDLKELMNDMKDLMNDLKELMGLMNDSKELMNDLKEFMNDLKELMGKVASRQRALELDSACLNGN